MKTTTDRVASAKRAWETMRANKAAGIPPASAGKAAPKPERDYSALIAGWLKRDGGPELDAARLVEAAVSAPQFDAAALAVVDLTGAGVLAAAIAEPEPIAVPEVPELPSFPVIAPPTAAKKVRKPRAAKVAAPVVAKAKAKTSSKKKVA